MMKKIGLSGKGKLDFYCEIYLNSRGLSVNVGSNKIKKLFAIFIICQGGEIQNKI